MRARWHRRLVTTGAAAMAAALGPVSASSQAPPSPPAGTVFLEFVALDASSRPVVTLAPNDLRVVIDGELRAVVSLRYVFRGTGAVAAARARAVDGGTPVAADPSRLVLFVVDENSFGAGVERTMVAAVTRAADVLAPTDRIGLVTLPEARNVTVEPDRQAFRGSLAGVRGRAVPIQERMTTADRRRADDQLRAPVHERARVPDELSVGPPETEADQPPPPTMPLLQDDASLREFAGVTRTSLDVLVDVLERLRGIQGPKTVIYVWGGTWGADPLTPDRPSDPRRDAERVISAAAAARAVIHGIAVGRSRASRPDATLERLARDTGGSLVTAADDGAWTGRLAGAMAGTYLAEVEERPGDLDGPIRSLEVSVAQKGILLLAPRRWSGRSDPLPSPINVGAERANAQPAPSLRAEVRREDPAASRSRSGRPRDPELETVLARAAEYLAAYLVEFSSVVAEEDYQQTASVVRMRGTRLDEAERESVHLRSDLLLVRTSDTADWTPFRDVFEVNGRPVRDREERLRKLFLENPDTAITEGSRIARESARYNVGPSERTINTPTLGLFFLYPEHRRNLRFERHGEDTIEGVHTWRVDFQEVEGPTVIREARTGADLPSTGSLWIDPMTGRIVKTLVRCEGKGFTDELTMLFRPSDSLGLWAPAEMKESYTTGGGAYTIKGVARYSKFRRFQVTTDEQVSIPKN